MKFKNLLTLSMLFFVLTGCNKECNHIDENKDHKCDLCGTILSECQDLNGDHFCNYCGKQLTPIPEEKKEEENPFTGGIVNDGVHTGYEFSKAKINRPTSGTGKVEIFGLNDFHGAVNEMYDGDRLVEAGLKRVGTFVKQQTSKPNTLFIDQGDTWQGSFESNYNHGQIVQDVFAYANMNLRTLGNHDFDWNLDVLKEIQSRKYNGYSIPTLASNVYDFDWDTKQKGTTQQSELGQEYATFTVENGLKIGFVGVIDESCITSIATQLVKSISFSNSTEKVKEISDYLRTEKNCDIVVATTHADQDLYYDLHELSPITNKRYVDLVLNGHSHQNEYDLRNGVLYTQWGCNGEYVGSVSLTYDFDNGKVIDSVEEDRTSYNAKYLAYYYQTIDPKINEMVDTYIASIQTQREKVLNANFTGEWSYIEELPNLMAKAIYLEAVNEGYNVDASVVNRARDSFNESVMTYSNLYRCFPFDNEVIIFNTSGIKTYGTLNQNNTYRENEELVINDIDTYLLAGLDYVALHVGPTRQYNYFSNIEVVGKLEKDGKALTYRDILADYLLSNSLESFVSSDYKSTDWHYFVN